MLRAYHHAWGMEVVEPGAPSVRTRGNDAEQSVRAELVVARDAVGADESELRELARGFLGDAGVAWLYPDAQPLAVFKRIRLRASELRKTCGVRCELSGSVDVCLAKGIVACTVLFGSTWDDGADACVVKDDEARYYLVKCV